MSSWAKPGVKCVFVGGGPDNTADYPGLTGKPVKGAVYTIRETMVSKRRYRGEVFLRLHEIVVKPHGLDWEDAWLFVGGFRPLVSLSDDVAMFKEIVERHPQIAQNSIHVSEDA